MLHFFVLSFLLAIFSQPLPSVSGHYVIDSVVDNWLRLEPLASDTACVFLPRIAFPQGAEGDVVFLRLRGHTVFSIRYDADKTARRRDMIRQLLQKITDP